MIDIMSILGKHKYLKENADLNKSTNNQVREIKYTEIKINCIVIHCLEICNHVLFDDRQRSGMTFKCQPDYLCLVNSHFEQQVSEKESENN